MVSKSNSWLRSGADAKMISDEAINRHDIVVAERAQRCGPGAVVYHCDALTVGAVHGSASAKIVNGSPVRSSVHGDPACVTEVVSIITGGFGRDRTAWGVGHPSGDSSCPGDGA